MNEIGTQIKQSSPYQGTFVLTHCNGSSGYICTDEAYPKGGYEVQVTKFWPGVEKVLTKNVEEMIKRLRYDILYIENMSLFVDLKILFYTAITIFKGRGV